MGLASLQIQNSNNADVLLDSGLKLFDIIANLCSKLYYGVLLKSRNYIVNLSKQTLVFRTWIVKFGCLVWVRKLADIVTKSLLCIYELCLESCIGSKEIKWVSKSKSQESSFILIRNRSSNIGNSSKYGILQNLTLVPNRILLKWWLLRYGSEWHYRQNRIKSIFRLVKW